MFCSLLYSVDFLLSTLVRAFSEAPPSKGEEKMQFLITDHGGKVELWKQYYNTIVLWGEEQRRVQPILLKTKQKKLANSLSWLCLVIGKGNFFSSQIIIIRLYGTLRKIFRFHVKDAYSLVPDLFSL